MYEYDEDHDDCYGYESPFYSEYGDDCDDSDFADPGGNSALRAETATNPRNLPCPTCGEPDMLTPKDAHRGYQCDDCANRSEGWGG
jgi:hypothetical protein